MSKKLLLADDSVTIQKVVGLVFANKEYDLQCVSNGDAAFEKISFERTDIVLADVNMPGKNGFELCSAIKNNPASSQVPVLLLVGAFEPFDEEQARSAGADGWIVKPFDSQDLVDEVESLLSRPAEAVSWPEPRGGADAGESDVWADMELDDLDMEAAGDAVALGETFNVEPDAGGVELEEEILWEEGQPAAEEPQPESASAAVEEVLAEEEEILFIDEDDLLDDEPEQIAVSTSVEHETPAPELDAPVAESDPFDLETDAPTTEPVAFAIETDTPAGASQLSEPAMEIPPESAAGPVSDEIQPAAEAPSQPEPEKAGLDFWRNESLISRLTDATDTPVEARQLSEPAMEVPPESAAGPVPGEIQPAAEAPSQPVLEKAGLDFWRNESLISQLTAATAPEPQTVPETSPPAGEPVEAVASDVTETVAPEVQETAEPHEEEVTAQVQALSEEELGRIVERVAGTVIERLAGSILEKIAWEVVPDLAENLIKEEIRKITETSH